ncbi:LysR substrate-binding domain-containing protein [Pendulispora albinea]|uniref:LysR family transcriptional regulator n=1 Tax=Pendulispora albinea TaxID=2741071 RepID=A0ABZ2LVL9_9BACT
MKIATEELEAFVAVVDTGSLSLAAKRLAQTTSGMSRALGRLEKKLGTTLLRRTTRQLRLTEEGELFLERARAILAAIESAEEAMASRKNKPAGRLRLDAAAPFILHGIVPHLREFAELYPDIHLEVASHDHIVDLLEERTDVAFRIGALSDSTLHAKAIGSCNLNIVASPAYLKAKGVPKTTHDLKKHRLIGFTSPKSLNDWPVRHDGAERMTIEPDLGASSGETIRALAVGGFGIACLANFMTHRDIADGALAPLLRSSMSDYRQPIHAVYYRNSPSMARIRCFLEFIAPRIVL